MTNDKNPTIQKSSYSPKTPKPITVTSEAELLKLQVQKKTEKGHPNDYIQSHYYSGNWKQKQTRTFCLSWRTAFQYSHRIFNRVREVKKEREHHCFTTWLGQWMQMMALGGFKTLHVKTHREMYNGKKQTAPWQADHSSHDRETSRHCMASV